jgi:dipeptide/tripeptide permease
MNLATLYIALYLIALGTGGIKSCVSAFGADQFDPHDPKEKKSLASFFNYFFFFICTGALIAVTLLVYIQDKVGRGWGFGITASCMLFAVVAFVGGKKLYRYCTPKGSPLSSVALVIVAAFKKRKLELPSNPATMLYKVPLRDKKDPIGEAPLHYVEKIDHTDQFL